MGTDRVHDGRPAAVVKFCGMTRPDDVRHASALGAAYVGVIFAGGPRRLDAANAARVLAPAGPATRRVGVFGEQSPAEIAAIAAATGLDVVQLHACRSARQIADVRSACGLAVWVAVRVRDALPPGAEEWFAAADAVVLDRLDDRLLGGTGRAFDWDAVGVAIEAVRGESVVVLAGGLTPANVRRGIDVLRPAVVDVASGVERAPGAKDHELMRAFARAACAGGAE